MLQLWDFDETSDCHNFFLLVMWQWLIYEKILNFYEVFKNQHRGTQKMTRTQNIDLVVFLTKNGPKSIMHIVNSSASIELQNHVLSLEIARTSHNSKFCQRNKAKTYFSRIASELKFCEFTFLVEIGNIVHKWNILGTCRFLGTTMLVFEKYTKNRILFIYWSNSFCK